MLLPQSDVLSRVFHMIAKPPNKLEKALSVLEFCQLRQPTTLLGTLVPAVSHTSLFYLYYFKNPGPTTGIFTCLGQGPGQGTVLCPTLSETVPGQGTVLCSTLSETGNSSLSCFLFIQHQKQNIIKTISS